MLVVQVKSPLANGTLLTNSATLVDTQGGSADASLTTTVQSAPILSLSISDSPDPVAAGEQITYVLSFSNSSSVSVTALGVTLTNTLPSNTTFVSASDAGSVDNTNTLVTWSLGDLAPGDGGIRTLVVQVDSSLADGTLLGNSATLQDTQGNSAAASQTATVQSTPILSLSVSDSSDPVAAGSEITYVLSFSNSSSADESAVGVTLTNTLPSNTTFVSASDEGSVDNTGTLVTWSLGDLAPGGSGTRTLVVQVNSPLANGTLLTNSATLKDTQGSSATSNENTNVQSASLLSLSVSDTPDPVEAGQEVTYKLSFSNSSSANDTAAEVTLTNTLAANTTFVSASDGGTVEGGIVTWSLGDLAPGASGTRTLVVQVNLALANGTLLTDSAKLKDSQGNTAIANQTTTVHNIAGLSLSQGFDPDPPFSGGQLTITLSFSHSSSSNETAFQVTLTDTLPTNTTFVAASDGGIVNDTGTLVTWSLGALAPGASGTRTLVVQLASSLLIGTQLVNNAALLDAEGHSSNSMYTTVVGVLDGVTVNSVVSRRFELNFAEPSQIPTSERFDFPTSSGEEPKQPAPEATTQTADGQTTQGAGEGTTQTAGGQTTQGAGEGTTQTAGGQTTQSAGEETAQGTWEETTQPPEGAGMQAVKQVTIETTDEGGVQRIYMTGGQAVNHETIVTTDEGGVDRIIITGRQVEINQQVASASMRTSESYEEQPQVSEEKGDINSDRFPNPDEVRYSLDLSKEMRTVERGSEVTFTVRLNRHDNFEGLVSFNIPNSIPGTLWTFSQLSAVLGPSDNTVPIRFSIKTTTTTPLGEHKIIIEATSSDMKMEKTLILKVEPSRKSSVPTEGLTPVSPS